MQLKLLGIEGTTSIAAAAAATKGLSLEEATAALATTNLTEAEIAAVLVKNGFTKAISLKSAAQAIEMREQEAVAAETMATAAAETAATATTIGLTGATSGLTAAFHGLKAAISSNPIGFIATVAVTAITLIMSLTSQVESAAEKLDESSNEVKDIQDKISDLNSDLKTTNKRIEELERKPNLTIIEQTELDRLRTTNDELERQIRLQETALRTAQSKNAANFVSAIEELQGEEKDDNQEYYETLSSGDAVLKHKSNSESFSWMLDWYKKSLY
jgi:cell division protein FtsB